MKPSEIIDKHSINPRQRENKRDEILDQLAEDIKEIKTLVDLLIANVHLKEEPRGIHFKVREWEK